MTEEKNPRARRMMFGCLGVFVGVVIALVIWLGPLVKAANKVGVLDPQVKRDYEGNTMENLKNIHNALLQYEASEGQLPFAETWMDAAWRRLQTADMDEDQAKRKLKSPSLYESNPQAFGYAFNEALSGQYSGDVENPAQTPLIFDSSDLTWNAFGNPAQLAPNPPRPEGNYAVTVEGNVMKLDELLKK
ncbi:MAG: hypothetical protein KF824_06295 [Fimbriimonadaceae bacterium]|nr:MAG: hypothetical protein KF824_06295 [Fimbriimonadaceae bacterium]